MKNLLVFLLIFLGFGVRSQVIPDSSLLQKQAPEKFRAEFRTTQGNFTIEVIREWAPLGADRLWHLLQTGFYNNNSIFRVQPEYVIQFGICDNPAVNSYWDKKPLPDEPAKTRNLKYTLSYARDGANSRTVQLFINKKDNTKLDTVNYNGLRGFTPVARIVEGQEVIEKFYGEYGFEPANYQDSIMQQGNAWIRKKFPKVDYIIDAKILEAQK